VFQAGLLGSYNLDKTTVSDLLQFFSLVELPEFHKLTVGQQEQVLLMWSSSLPHHPSQIQRVKMFEPGFFARGSDELMQHYLLNIDVNVTGPPIASINANKSCEFLFNTLKHYNYITHF